MLKADRHLYRLDGETHLLRHVKRYYAKWFPLLPDQSRLWHRIRELLPTAEAFRQHLLRIFGHLYEDIRIFDTMPLPVCPVEKALRMSEFPEADFGYCSSKPACHCYAVAVGGKEYYFGFKLGLSILPIGLPVCLAAQAGLMFLKFYKRVPMTLITLKLSSPVVEHFTLGIKACLCQRQTGFISEEKINALEKQYEKLVVTPQRENHQNAGNTPLEDMLLWAFRPKSEAVFSILTAMRIKKTGAKTTNGLLKRVYGIVLAFSVGVYINVVCGRYPMEVIGLFG